MIVRFIYLMTCLSFFVHGESIAQTLAPKNNSAKNGSISQFHPKDSKKELRTSSSWLNSKIFDYHRCGTWRT